MGLQHVENLLRRYRGQRVNVKTTSGGVYEGTVADITNDYVALAMKNEDESRETVFVLLHSIEAVLPRSSPSGSGNSGPLQI
jgi:small nuclear ribonucleoprotein (snRNP)-like protein